MSPTERPVTGKPPAATPPDSAGGNGVPQPSGEDGRDAAVGLLSEAEFQEKNRRRSDLVRKDERQGLTPEEQTELTQLEGVVRSYLQARFPGPKELFGEVEERLRKLGLVP